MKVKKFNFEIDYERVKNFLTNCYKENKNMVCWLPQRFSYFIIVFKQNGLENKFLDVYSKAIEV